MISDEDETYVSESEHDTESEQSGEEYPEDPEDGNEGEQNLSRQDVFFGREKINPTRW